MTIHQPDARGLLAVRWCKLALSHLSVSLSAYSLHTACLAKVIHSLVRVSRRLKSSALSRDPLELGLTPTRPSLQLNLVAQSKPSLKTCPTRYPVIRVKSSTLKDTSPACLAKCKHESNKHTVLCIPARRSRASRSKVGLLGAGSRGRRPLKPTPYGPYPPIQLIIQRSCGRKISFPLCGFRCF